MVARPVRTAAVVMPSRWMACPASWSCLTADPGMGLTTAGGGSWPALAVAHPARNRAAAATEAREAGLLVRMTDSLRVLRGAVSLARPRRPAGARVHGAGNPVAPALAAQALAAAAPPGSTS